MNDIAVPAQVRAVKVPGEIPADKYTSQRITWIERLNDHLFRFRTTRDRGYRFKPGQFARLGLYRDDVLGRKQGPRFAWRAYSIASADYDEHLEFYSIVVPEGDFTTQLSELRVGDELLIERQAYGFLTLDRFENGRDLWMLSSGTGIAPFISVLADLQAWEQYRRLILVHSVREPDELAYREDIEALRSHEIFGELLRDDPQRLVYVPIVTRGTFPGALSSRIQVAIVDGTLEATAGVAFSDADSRFMICGNPDMVDQLRELLTERGYQVSRRGAPAHLAVENYW